MLGVLALQENRLDVAADQFQRVIAVNPNNASYHCNLGNARLAQGKIDEAIACLSRALELNPGLAEAHNNMGLAIKAQGRFEDAAACHRRALQLNPVSVNAHNNLGFALRELGRFDEAVACYRRALELKPDYAEVYNNLGIVCADQEKLDEAVSCYQRALALKPSYAEAHNNMGAALRSQGKVNEAVACYQRALQLKPGYVEAHNNLASSLSGQGKLAEAEAQFDEALRLRPQYAEARSNRSFLYLLRGDFERGWPEYEWRLASQQNSPWRRNFPQPRWDGSPLQGRTILLYAEQGLGDTLQFIRYAPLVAQAGGKVIVECPAPLKRLLQTSLESIVLTESGQAPPPFDVHAPLLSLPLAFGTTLPTIPRQVPYLHADADLAARWRQQIDHEAEGLKVGLVWAGNKSHKNDRNRSLPLSTLAPLGKVPGIRFFSLQKRDSAASQTESGPIIAASPAQSRPPAELQLVDWTEDLHDFADTAAVIANLDLVIAADTAVGHLAGAMAKPAWMLLPFIPDWRWLLDRDDSPWYPTMRLFRQPAEHDWPSVIARVADRLRAYPKTPASDRKI